MLLDQVLLDDVKASVSCRGRQFDKLNIYLDTKALATPPALVVHGAPATGKSAVLNAFLEHSELVSASVKSDECVSVKMLLQRIYRNVANSMDVDGDPLKITDNFAAFLEALQKILPSEEPYVLVLDRIDQFPETPAIKDVINCFARHNELCAIDNLVVVFTISSLQPRSLISTAVPNLHFPRYTQQEAIKVVQSLKPAEQKSSVWSHFIHTVVNGLSSYTGTDIRLIKDVAAKLWPEYTRPIQEGSILPTEHAKLYNASKHLFTSEWAVSNDLIQQPDDDTSHHKYDLPDQCKFLLCAAYLASYNPPKSDFLHFSKAKGVRAPRKTAKSLVKAEGQVNRRSLAPPSFEMERMLAILYAIADEKVIPSVTVQQQIANLCTLRLLLRAGKSDPLHAKAKWKVNVGWKMIDRIAQDIGIDLRDYLYE